MIYKNIAHFLRRRTIELIGLILIFSALLLAISFLTYLPSDPILIHGSQNVDINNLLGIYGGSVADFLLQSFGLVAFLFLITITIWGISLIVKKQIKKMLLKIFFLMLYLIFSCVFIYIIFNNSFWLIDNGNSGFVGHVLYSWMSNFLPNINNEYILFVCGLLSIIFFILASNINIKYLLVIPKIVKFIFNKN